jgi:hypothetical protein
MNASVKCLLLCLCLMIQSCGQLPTKPSLERKPPQIACAERRPIDSPPAAPASTDWREWAAAFAAALGWGTQSEDYRADTADCLDQHRKAGDIR